MGGIEMKIESNHTKDIFTCLDLVQELPASLPRCWFDAKSPPSRGAVDDWQQDCDATSLA